MIRVGIVGYGNLGRALEGLIQREEDMELVKIFTRRNPSDLNHEMIASLDDIEQYRDRIDVMVLSVGSSTDMFQVAPQVIPYFHTVDSYDTHKRIPEYFEMMDKLGKDHKTCSFVSTGWDPGLFSLQRFIGEQVLPQGETYTFWGKGVSQGHSDAVRRIEGVRKAVQYTLPKEEILETIYDQKGPLSSGETHRRLVYVVKAEGADEEKIRQSIVTMKYYFDEYETEVVFISDEEYERDHTGMPHGGHVYRIGETLNGHREVYHFSLELDSNPEFTGAVDLAGVRAVYRFAQEEKYGAHTVLDTPPYYYGPWDHLQALSRYL